MGDRSGKVRGLVARFDLPPTSSAASASSQVSKGAHKKEPIIGPPLSGSEDEDSGASGGYLTFERFSPASLAPSSHEWYCLFLAAYGIIMHLDLAIASSFSLSLHETFAIKT